MLLTCSDENVPDRIPKADAPTTFTTGSPLTMLENAVCSRLLLLPGPVMTSCTQPSDAVAVQLEKLESAMSTDAFTAVTAAPPVDVEHWLKLELLTCIASQPLAGADA